ncbi:hypothetical protein [Crenothrix sp.]|uniref:hypothetical protein n=1 Tax=Crenothrix sp. TaxID=3100433 RepID=UPI00374DD1D4
MKTLSSEQLEQIQHLQYCLRSISQLLDPSDDLKTVDRDGLYFLISFLSGKSLESTQQQRCLSAVNDLLVSGSDHSIDHGDLSVLLGCLASQMDNILAGGL